MIISGTYAFFAPQQGGTTSTNATVTSNTTDLLTFSINRDISFTVNQANFEENGQATMNKLQADSCHSLSYYANCHFGNFECNVLSDGWVDCRTGRDDYCGVTAEGAASCVW